MEDYSIINTEQVYSVYIHPDTRSVNITPLGMEVIEFELEGEYTWSDLPSWMTDKLAVLNTLHVPPPPTNVAGVGKRISPDRFWVYK
jgi:hypothetical protein